MLFKKLFNNIFFIKKTDKYNEATMSHDEIVKVLCSHPAIEELRDWSSYRCRVLDIKDPIKKRMAEYFLSLFFGKLRDAILDIVEHYGDYIDDTTLLNNLIIDTINNVKDEAMTNGVPQIFLDKFINYLYKQARILSLSFKDLDKFQYYNGVIEKSAFRLDLGFMLIRCITYEVEEVINNMNGELKSALEGSIFDK